METDKIDEVLKELLTSETRQPSPETAAQSWLALCPRIKAKRRRRLGLTSAAAVAVVCACLFIPGKHSDDVQTMAQYAASMPQTLDREGDIKLSISGRPDMVISSSDVNIIHSGNGVVTIDSDVQGKVVVRESSASEQNSTSVQDFNQVVVPVGKRTHLTLSDGTRIWMNSGSRLIYPESFGKESRDVFLEGEAYFEVSHNEACPFYVKTGNYDVAVKGTVFDVSAYPNRNETFVILVNGSVDVDSHEGPVCALKPGQIVKLQGSDMAEPEYADITPYVSWVKDYLVFKNEKLGIALEKIGRQYGKTFLLAPGTSEITVSGKLYLKDDLSSILRSISFSVPVNFEDHNESIYVHEAVGDF